MAASTHVTSKNTGTANDVKPSNGKKNADLLPCDKPHVAEASRNQEEDDACDDGVH